MNCKCGALAPGLALCMSLLVVQAASSGQVDPTRGEATPNDVCQDSQGGFYSPGATVDIDGKTMECVIGPHWVPAGSAAGKLPADVLDVGDTNVNADVEAAILRAFTNTPLPTLQSDAVLNSDQSPESLTHVPPGEKRLVMFWTPTCGPCKPLLADMAVLADARPEGLSLLGVVQSAVPDLEPPGEWRLLRVEQLMAQYKVGFPTCVYSSREQKRRWHAQGMPLTLLLSQKCVERVAAGGRNGEQLVAELAARR